MELDVINKQHSKQICVDSTTKSILLILLDMKTHLKLVNLDVVSTLLLISVLVAAASLNYITLLYFVNGSRKQGNLSDPIHKSTHKLIATFTKNSFK